MDLLYDCDSIELVYDNNDILDIQDEIYLFDKYIQKILIADHFSEKRVFDCCICLEKIQEEKIIYLKNCKHEFCLKCINKVLYRKNKKTPCPLCRILFTKNDIIKPIDKKNNKCKCGSTNHKKTNHLSCPLNRKKV